MCMLFGILQQRFVLNASVNFILNKFITQVAPPSDKTQRFAIRLENAARPLYSNAHIFKITGLFCTLFGSLQCRVVLNMSDSFTFIKYVIQSGATW